MKDLEDAEGFVTTCGDPARRGRPPAARDSVQVARLRAAGAIVIGKTNTPAYGFQAETDNLVFGPTRNPWAPNRTSGGSSGGSAAAVASGLVALCTGSDGGGSIRIPSAVCGISGFKPTHGVVPNGDADSPTWGPFSTRGPMARTFAEIAYALDVVAGYSRTRSHVVRSRRIVRRRRGARRRSRACGSSGRRRSARRRRTRRWCRRASRRSRCSKQHGARVVETVDSVFEEPPVHRVDHARRGRDRCAPRRWIRRRGTAGSFPPPSSSRASVSR